MAINPDFQRNFAPFIFVSAKFADGTSVFQRYGQQAHHGNHFVDMLIVPLTLSPCAWFIYPTSVGMNKLSKLPPPSRIVRAGTRISFSKDFMHAHTSPRCVLCCMLSVFCTGGMSLLFVLALPSYIHVQPLFFCFCYVLHCLHVAWRSAPGAWGCNRECSVKRRALPLLWPLSGLRCPLYPTGPSVGPTGCFLGALWG